MKPIIIIIIITESAVVITVYWRHSTVQCLVQFLEHTGTLSPLSPSAASRVICWVFLYNYIHLYVSHIILWDLKPYNVNCLEISFFDLVLYKQNWIKLNYCWVILLWFGWQCITVLPGYYSQCETQKTIYQHLEESDQSFLLCWVVLLHLEINVN